MTTKFLIFQKIICYFFQHNFEEVIQNYKICKRCRRGEGDIVKYLEWKIKVAEEGIQKEFDKEFHKWFLSK